MDPSFLWWFLPRGYLLTVAIETPVLLLGLSRHHPVSRRLLAGLWLTACTYPIVVLVLPLLLMPEGRPDGRWIYLLVAEVFAPIAECALFSTAFHPVGASAGTRRRDFVAIVLANLASFAAGEVWSALTRSGAGM